MEHLGTLIGNPELARQALKKEYLRDAYSGEDGKLLPLKFLTKFKKLSPKQKNYFFAPEEQTLLKSALKAQGAAKTVAVRHMASHYGTPIGLGAVAGGLIGEHEGEGWGKGALTGAALGGTLGLLPKLFISPRGANIAAHLAHQGINPRLLGYPASSTLLSLFQ